MIILAALIYFAIGAVLAGAYKASCRSWYGGPEIVASIGILLFWPISVTIALLTPSE